MDKAKTYTLQEAENETLTRISKLAEQHAIDLKIALEQTIEFGESEYRDNIKQAKKLREIISLNKENFLKTTNDTEKKNIQHHIDEAQEILKPLEKKIKIFEINQRRLIATKDRLQHYENQKSKTENNIYTPRTPLEIHNNDDIHLPDTHQNTENPETTTQKLSPQERNRSEKSFLIQKKSFLEKIIMSQTEKNNTNAETKNTTKEELGEINYALAQNTLKEIRRLMGELGVANREKDILYNNQLQEKEIFKILKITKPLEEKINQEKTFLINLIEQLSKQDIQKIATATYSFLSKNKFFFENYIDVYMNRTKIAKKRFDELKEHLEKNPNLYEYYRFQKELKEILEQKLGKGNQKEKTKRSTPDIPEEDEIKPHDIIYLNLLGLYTDKRNGGDNHDIIQKQEANYIQQLEGLDTEERSKILEKIAKKLEKEQEKVSIIDQMKKLSESEKLNHPDYDQYQEIITKTPAINFLYDFLKEVLKHFKQEKLQKNSVHTASTKGETSFPIHDPQKNTKNKQNKIKKRQMNKEKKLKKRQINKLSET